MVGALSLGGFVAGAFLGSRVAPLLLSGGSESPYTPLVTLVVAVTLGGVLATALETLGFGLRRKMGPTLGAIDGAAGRAARGLLRPGPRVGCGCGGAPDAGARRTLRRDIQRSTILQELNDALPPSGPLLNALARFDPLPSVNGPPADVPGTRIRA